MMKLCIIRDNEFIIMVELVERKCFVTAFHRQPFCQINLTKDFSISEKFYLFIKPSPTTFSDILKICTIVDEALKWTEYWDLII